MIKCRICSYQCDNWYVRNWRQAVNAFLGPQPSKGRRNSIKTEAMLVPGILLSWCFLDFFLKQPKDNIQKHNWRTGDPCYINYFATSREYKPYFWCAENLWTWRGGCDLSFLPPTPEPTSLSQWAPNHFPPSSWSVQSGYFSCGEPTQPGDWPAKQSWWETNGGKKERGKKKCFEVTDLRLMILRLETFRFCWLNCTATKFLHVLVSFPRSWFFTLWHPGLPVLGCCLWCTEGCGCGARSRESKFQKTSNQVRQHDIE